MGRERERRGSGIISRAVCDERNGCMPSFFPPSFFLSSLLFSLAPGRGKDNSIKKPGNLDLKQRRREKRRRVT